MERLQLIDEVIEYLQGLKGAVRDIAELYPFYSTPNRHALSAQVLKQCSIWTPLSPDLNAQARLPGRSRA